MEGGSRGGDVEFFGVRGRRGGLDDMGLGGDGARP
jgi:hypothetical protein